MKSEIDWKEIREIYFIEQIRKLKIQIEITNSLLEKHIWIFGSVENDLVSKLLFWKKAEKDLLKRISEF